MIDQFSSGRPQLHGYCRVPEHKAAALSLLKSIYSAIKGIIIEVKHCAVPGVIGE